MPSIILVRHGMTDKNAQGLMSGNAEAELTAEGIAQAHKTGEALKRFTVERFISSPLSRARRTAEIIGQYLGKEFLIEEDLRERSFGEFEGKHHELYFSHVAALGISHEEFRPPGGESGKEVQSRVVPIINREAELGTNSLLVVHGQVIKAVMSHYFGKGFMDYSTGNCAIFVIDTAPWRLVVNNDVTHLG